MYHGGEKAPLFVVAVILALRVAHGLPPPVVGVLGKRVIRVGTRLCFRLRVGSNVKLLGPESVSSDCVIPHSPLARLFPHLDLGTRDEMGNLSHKTAVWRVKEADKRKHACDCQLWRAHTHPWTHREQQTTCA